MAVWRTDIKDITVDQRWVYISTTGSTEVSSPVGLWSLLRRANGHFPLSARSDISRAVTAGNGYVYIAIIPTGQIPKTFREDEKKLYDLIVRRFIAAFLPSAERQTITRITEVEGETFKVNARKLLVPGWRAVEPSAKDDPGFPPLAEDGAVTCSETDLIEKATTPPNRFSDGSLVAEMETCDLPAMVASIEEPFVV